MKVLILHNDLRVYWNRRLIFLHQFLKSKGIDFYAIDLFGKGSPYVFDPYNHAETWRYCIFPDNSCEELSKTQIKNALFSRLSEINPDVVIAGSIVFFSGALGLRWAKSNKKKFIMFDDAKPSGVKRNFFVQAVKNLITRQIDALWLPSNEYDKEYTRLYSKKAVYYFYGYSCIDNQLFKFGDQKKLDNNRIITVARLVPKKNIYKLLQAWKFVEGNNNSYTLSIIGDGPMLAELKDFAKHENLNRVDFLGAIPNDKIPRYLYEADAFVLPSLSETWGLVVNEAMAAGLPVLLSNGVNAAPTLLKEGVNGYSFNPEDLENMQQKIMDFINLPVTAKQKMSANSLKIISSMDYENMGNELLTTLNLLNAKPFKKPWLLPRLAINSWYGRYNTAGWDTV